MECRSITSRVVYSGAFTGAKLAAFTGALGAEEQMHRTKMAKFVRQQKRIVVVAATRAKQRGQRSGPGIAPGGAEGARRPMAKAGAPDGRGSATKVGRTDF